MNPDTLRRVYLTNAATAVTLRGVQEMRFQSAFPVEQGAPDPDGSDPGLLAALQRTMVAEQRLIGLLHDEVNHEVEALASGDMDALLESAAAMERHTVALRELVRERIALTRMLVAERTARAPRRRRGRTGAGLGQVVAFDQSVRAGAGKALADLLGGQSAVASTLALPLIPEDPSVR